MRILFFILVLSGCASATVLPSLENRGLEFDLDRPILKYQWKECTKKVVGICLKWTTRVDIYDLTDPVVRKQIVDMGFVAKTRGPVKP